MKTRPRPAPWLIILLFGVGTVLAGCGQKGPLRLPDETPIATQQK